MEELRSWPKRQQPNRGRVTKERIKGSTDNSLFSLLLSMQFQNAICKHDVLFCTTALQCQSPAIVILLSATGSTDTKARSDRAVFVHCSCKMVATLAAFLRTSTIHGLAHLAPESNDDTAQANLGLDSVQYLVLKRNSTFRKISLNRLFDCNYRRARL